MSWSPVLGIVDRHAILAISRALAPRDFVASPQTGALTRVLGSGGWLNMQTAKRTHPTHAELFLFTQARRRCLTATCLLTWRTRRGMNGVPGAVRRGLLRTRPRALTMSWTVVKTLLGQLPARGWVQLPCTSATGGRAVSASAGLRDLQKTDQPIASNNPSSRHHRSSRLVARDVAGGRESRARRAPRRPFTPLARALGRSDPT